MKRIQDNKNPRKWHFYQDDGTYDGWELELEQPIPVKDNAEFGAVVRAIVKGEEDPGTTQ
jgi:hypothetical protein